MTTLSLPAPRQAIRCGSPRILLPQAQQGVVLVIALVLLVVISMLAITSMRNAGSSESVAGNVRTTELATQAADIALRHCEASILKILSNANGDYVSQAANYPTTFNSGNIAATSSPPQWQEMTRWDGSSTAVFVLPLYLVNQTGMAITTYKRPPECMVEQVPVQLKGTTTVSTTSLFVVTARGFGPEVAANHSRPVGSEVWLQSNIEFQKN